MERGAVMRAMRGSRPKRFALGHLTMRAWEFALMVGNGSTLIEHVPIEHVSAIGEGV
jgi:hypothetical protein